VFQTIWRHFQEHLYNQSQLIADSNHQLSIASTIFFKNCDSKRPLDDYQLFSNLNLASIAQAYLLFVNPSIDLAFIGCFVSQITPKLQLGHYLTLVYFLLVGLFIDLVFSVG